MIHFKPCPKHANPHHAREVCRSIVQKKALADTFDPSIPRPSALTPYNPGPFFAEAAHLASTKGIGGLYAGVGPKMVHLGGSGAILAVLMPRFKSMWTLALGPSKGIFITFYVFFRGFSYVFMGFHGFVKS